MNTTKNLLEYPFTGTQLKIFGTVNTVVGLLPSKDKEVLVSLMQNYPAKDLSFFTTPMRAASLLLATKLGLAKPIPLIIKDACAILSGWERAGYSIRTELIITILVYRAMGTYRQVCSERSVTSEFHPTLWRISNLIRNTWADVYVLDFQQLDEVFTYAWFKACNPEVITKMVAEDEQYKDEQ